MKKVMPWLAALMATVTPLRTGRMFGASSPKLQAPMSIPTSRRGRDSSGAWRRGGRLHTAALSAWYEQLLARKEKRPIRSRRP